MKKNEFVKLIRETVSKEVRRAVRTELNEILNPPDNSVKTFNEQIQNGVQMQQRAEASPQEHVKYTNNGTLNEILNETANDMKSYPTAGGRPLSAADAVGGKASLAAAMGLPPLGAEAGPPSAQEMIPADRQGAPIPDAVGKALTRDYSGLMKAINKKRG
mgnify:CR=1 FL=1|tara:strand:- start:2768 stop:3247 length:480 start_codon:yes stop_codon:yes gene_type:complete